MPALVTQLQALQVVVTYGVANRAYTGIASLNVMEAAMSPAVALYLSNVRAAMTYIQTPGNTRKFAAGFIQEMEQVLGGAAPMAANIFELLKRDTPATWLEAQREIDTLIAFTQDVHKRLSEQQMWGWGGPDP